jgi:cytoskeletal protein RodZ
MLDRFQKKHIREKIAEIGNAKQIKEFYKKDDEVSKYALEQLEKGGYKNSKAKVYYRIKEYKEVPIKKPEIMTSYADAMQKMKTKAEEKPKRMFTITKCNKKGK